MSGLKLPPICRVVLVLSGLTLGAGAAVEAQRPVQVSSWITELGGGAGADLLARGPWMDETWGGNAAHRIVFATMLSLLYEYAVEPWNGQTNSARWQDAGQRLVGTLTAELVGALFSIGKGGKRAPAPSPS